MPPYPKSPSAYLRCFGCNRLTEKKNATIINGRPYGRECRQKAVAAMATPVEELLTRQESS